MKKKNILNKKLRNKLFRFINYTRKHLLGFSIIQFILMLLYYFIVLLFLRSRNIELIISISCIILIIFNILLTFVGWKHPKNNGDSLCLRYTSSSFFGLAILYTINLCSYVSTSKGIKNMLFSSNVDIFSFSFILLTIFSVFTISLIFFKPQKLRYLFITILVIIIYGYFVYGGKKNIEVSFLFISCVYLISNILLDKENLKILTNSKKEININDSHLYWCKFIINTINTVLAIFKTIIYLIPSSWIKCLENFLPIYKHNLILKSQIIHVPLTNITCNLFSYLSTSIVMLMICTIVATVTVYILRKLSKHIINLLKK